MKASWVVALVAAVAASGCAAGEPANPTLAAPKLVLHVGPDGETAIFLHAAFGERMYDWISVAIDNETLVNRSIAFSIEEHIARTGFYFDVRAGTSRETYELQGRVDADPAAERALVSLVDEDGDWSDAQTFGLPFERVLARRDAV